MEWRLRSNYSTQKCFPALKNWKADELKIVLSVFIDWDSTQGLV